MLARLTAVRFERLMTRGRTSPALCGCENQAGAYVGEYVVKLRGAVGAPGLLNELFAARLAGHFGLATPEPALITMEPALVEQIAAAEISLAVKIRDSAGLNFGSRYVQGASPWPVDKSIPAALWQRATDIFAFDALIQNPDRRYANQNLLAVGEDLLIFDHEAAFSFLLALAPPEAPWNLEDQKYLANHVFYRRLKSKVVDLANFTGALRRLSAEDLARLAAELPVEWKNGRVARIERHLHMVREHADEFGAAIRRCLV